MEYILLAVFVLGYLGIALEHNIKIDKAASALLTGTVLWGLFVLGYHEVPPHLTDMFAEFVAGSHGDMLLLVLFMSTVSCIICRRFPAFCFSF